MSNAAAPLRLSEPIHPPAIEVQEVWPWALLVLALTLLLYLVGVEQGAASALPGQVLHEWAHDGRHLLAFPCH